MSNRETRNRRVGYDPRFHGLTAIAARQGGCIEASVKVCHNTESAYGGAVAPSSEAVLMMPTERYVTRNGDVSHDEGRLEFKFVEYLVKHDGRNWVPKLGADMAEAWREVAG